MNKTLNKILLSSYDNSIYYRTLYKNNNISRYDLQCEEVIKQIPILKKDDIINYFDDIVHEDYKYLKRKELEIVRTSGSSGKFVEVLWNKKEMLSSNMCIWRKRKQWYDIGPGDKKCSFISGTTIGATVLSTINGNIQLKQNELNLSVTCMNDKNLHDYYNAIVCFNPKWIYATSSSLMILIDFCERNNYKINNSLKYIELYGELVTEGALLRIKNFFHVPVAIMYGAKEVNSIALMCPFGKFHVLSDNVFLENENGKLLVTSLKNTVFPIIRYDIGDIVTFEKDSYCTCCEKSMIIKEIQGRKDKLHFINANKDITTEALINIVYVVNARFNNPILQYQFVENHTDLKLYIYIKNKYESWINSIKEELQLCISEVGLDDINCQVVVSTEPLKIDLKSSKLNQVIRNMRT